MNFFTTYNAHSSDRTIPGHGPSTAGLRVDGPCSVRDPGPQAAWVAPSDQNIMMLYMGTGNSEAWATKAAGFLETQIVVRNWRAIMS